MARGMAVGEAVVSQASTDEYRANHDRALGEKPSGVRGRWIWDEARKELVRAEDYRPPPRAVDAPIIADRIHEGTYFDDGERVRDIGSRRKRREFLRETGLAEASDYSSDYRSKAFDRQSREYDRKIEGAADEAARKLYYERKVRD